MNIIDVVIIVFIILGGLQGLQRGLLTGLGNLLAAIAGFIIAASQYLGFLTWVEGYLPIRQWMEPLIYDMILPSVKSKVGALEGQTLNGVLNLLPPALRENTFPGSLPDLGLWTQQASEQVALNLAGVVTENVLRIAAFLLLYFVVVAVIRLIVGVLLRPVGGREGMLNRFGGAVFGGLSSFIFFSVLVGLLTPFFDVIPTELPLRDWVQNAMIYPYLLSMFEFLSGVFWQAIGPEILEPFRTLNFTFMDAIGIMMISV